MNNKGYALHIGLNKVDRTHYSDIRDLSCCVNDAQAFSKISSGIPFNKVEMLLNEDATSDNYNNLLQAWSEELQTGDILWITYSGHGGRKPDMNGDDADNWDETWCLYNREYVDDEQFEAFSKFKEGVRILIFSDSCHSGTSAKGLPGDLIEVPVIISTSLDWETFKKSNNAKSRNAPIQGCVNRFIQFKDVYEPILKRKAIKPEEIGAYVVLYAACKDEQECIEFGENGYFTSVMLKALSDLNKCPTYNDLYKLIQAADLGNNQNVYLDRYGNETYNFLTTFPISINGKPFSFTTVNGNGVNDKTGGIDEVIIHEAATARSDANDPSHTTVVKTDAGRTAWDKAYLKYYERQQSQAAATKNVFIEPNTKSEFFEKKLFRGTQANNYLSHWPKPATGVDEFIWHLDDNHSELKKAAQAVMVKYGNNIPPIRIAHIDTGYRKHISQPKGLKIELGRNFINGQNTNDAEDKFNTGFPAEQDGHGCATLAILAGNEIQDGQGYVPYKGFVGAIPFAEVIPIRICETVYNLFNANDVATAIDYAVKNNCEVITMSMAGYPTQAVAAAVNRAYEKGVIMVTAAGNNWFQGLQKAAPKSVLYPARFERVIAATGACYDGFPYDSEAPRTNAITSRSAGGEVMQGNWGPEAIMDHALAAYTPNLFWANNDNNMPFLRSGGGTSSATPQIAAAAALWLSYNRAELSKLHAPWQRVEAARKALFSTASKAYPLYKKYYGNGIVRAHKALSGFLFSDEAITGLAESKKAKVSFLGIIPFIKQWFRSKAAAAAATGEDHDAVLADMFSSEVLQLIHIDPALMYYAEQMDFDDDKAYDFLQEPEGKRAFFSALSQSKFISDELKKQVDDILKTI